MTPMRSDYLKPMRPAELDDMRAALKGFDPGGHYPAADLYAAYERAMATQDRQPVHSVEFGRMLIRFGAIRKAKWSREHRHMVKGWII